MRIIRVTGINAPGRSLGCEKTPPKIIEALEEIGSNEKNKPIDKSLLDFEEIHVDNSNISEANKLIYKNAKKEFETRQKVLFIGGDHSISYSLAKAFNDSIKKPFLIIFDAHADAVNPGKEPTHEEWLRAIVEEGFSPENIVLIGARNIWQEERIFLQEKRIKVFSMQDVHENKENICDILMEKARESEGFYISIDIDAMDPAFAPGTGYLEPGGLSSREMIYFLQRLMLLKNFRGGDIVEINSETDKKYDNQTIKLGAKLLAEMI